MEQPKVVLTITEQPVGDGIHTELRLQCEMYPPLGENDAPSISQVAAMLAMDAITQHAERCGGGIQEMRTSPTHDLDNPGYWGV